MAERNARALAPRLFALLLAAWLAAAAWASPWPTREWERASPESQGVDPAGLLRLNEALARPPLRVDSVLVVRHGRVVGETYFEPYAPGLLHDLRSVTKSVLGTLVGIAIRRGELKSLDQTIESFFPEHFNDSRRRIDPRQRAITIAHLLNMRAGIEWREWPYDEQSDVLRMAASADPVRYILERPMREAPGRRFHYSGAAPQLLAAILQRATGLDAAAYARRELFAPLGISNFRWRTDARGNPLGESGLSLQPTDLAKIGLLILRDGQWEGRRLLPPHWLSDLLARAQPHGLSMQRGLPPRYSALWWVDDRVPLAAAIGRHGQHLMLLPQQDALVVVVAKTADAEQPLKLAELAATRVLPAMRGRTPLRPDPAARTRLDAMARAARALPAVVPPSETSTRMLNRPYALESNPLLWTELSVEQAAADGARLVLRWRAPSAPTASGRLELPFTWDGEWQRTFLTAEYVIACRAGWQGESMLHIELQDLQSAVVTELRLQFSKGGALALDVSDGDGLRFSTTGRVR